MNITLEQFNKTIPTNKAAAIWYAALPAFFSKYELNTRNRIAAFLAQTGHESQDYRAVEENLNYSAERLLEIFGRYYAPALAAAHARKPELIANHVYDDRHPKRSNKLGNIYDGDGWKFRGGGIKQLTGRYNYEQFGKSIGMTADEAAAYVRTPAGSLESAGWFWKTNNLARFADADDITGMSKAINGGTIGLADRVRRYGLAKAALPATIVLGAVTPSVVKPTPPPIINGDLDKVVLKVGSKGDLVKRVQSKLGIRDDGDYGRLTAEAVKSHQRINRIVPATGELTQRQINTLLN